MKKLLVALAMLAGAFGASAESSVSIAKNATAAEINAAIQSVDEGGTVKFPAGTWTLDATLVLDRAVTVEGAGPASTTLDFNSACRGFSISDANAAVKSLRIYRGVASNESGGGVKMTDGLVSNCKFDTCKAGEGSTSGGGGGALISGGRIESCEFVACENTALYSQGAALHIAGGTVSGCDFHGNDKGYSHNNVAYGGAIVALRGGVLENSRVHDNKKDSNPGIYLFNNNDTPTVRNCVVDHNSGKYGSAGIYLDAAAGVIAYCTVCDNEIADDATGCSGLVCTKGTVKNSIFVGNGTAGVAKVSGTPTISHNVFDQALEGFTDNVVGDPLFVNGGCQIASSESPAVGAAEPMADVTTDIGGFARSATAPTCGAFECRPTLIDAPAATAAETRQMIQQALDAAAFSPAGLVELGEGTFEIDQQLLLKNGVTLQGQGWDSTTVKQVNSTESTTTRCAYVDGNAKLVGMTLTGGHVDGGSWGLGGGNVGLVAGEVSYCRIENGKVTGSYPGGAGISIKQGVLDHCIVANNHESGTYSDGGGGVLIKEPTGEVLIDCCLIRDNRASCGNNYRGGGGIAVSTGNNPSGCNATIRNSTIVHNQCDNLGGGGLAVGSNGGQKANVTVINTIIADNTSLAGTECNFASSDGIRADVASRSYGNLFANGTLALGANSLSIEGSGVDAGWFVVPELDDFRLSGTSPACGAGAGYEGIGLDLDGNAFDALAPSIGCYEATDTTEAPAFDPETEATFYPTTNVTLSCATEGAAIYYTLDGSVPTEASTLYEGPIVVSERKTTVTARAYAPEMGPSKVAVATFYRVKPMPGLDEFKKFVEITLNTSLSESETADVPALVRLSESIEGFDYDDFDLANGGDMMFVAQDGTVLPHEVDTWDAEGESLVWVKLPSTAANTKITLYYGNGASTSEESFGVWSDYIGVWHLNEATEAVEENAIGTYANSTATEGIDGNVAKTTIVDEGGKFGKAFRTNDSTGKQTGNFNNGGVWVNDAGTDSPIDGGQNFTISGWFKHDTFGYYYDHFFYKRSASGNGGSPNNAFAIECNSSSGSNPQIQPRGSSSSGGVAYTSSTGAIYGVWEYITFVYNGTKCYVYSNGELKGSASITACIDNDAPLTFGNNCAIATDANGKGDAAWNGWIDEVRYVKGSMSDAWVATEYAAMNVGASDIFTFGDVEDTDPGLVAAPVFDPADGLEFSTPITVSLTCKTAGAQIYYTTDGKDPTFESSAYADPIAVTETTTIKAVAIKEGTYASEIVTATYTFVEPVAPSFGEVTVTAKRLANEADISGAIASVGNDGATACDVYLAYGTDAASLPAATKIAEGVTDSFTYTIKGLSAETTYAYVLSISNDAVTVRGAETSGSFTTFDPSAPILPAESAAATRQAVQSVLDEAAAMAQPGTVTLGEGLFEIDAQLMITNGVTVRGQGMDKTILKYVGPGNNADSRVATLADGSKLVGVTVTGAKVGQNQYVGGAITITGTEGATVSWCCVTNNVNSNGCGGGIGIYGTGTVKIDHTVVANNQAGLYIDRAGGGIGMRPGGSLDLEIDACLVYGNTVGANSCGAGIGLAYKDVEKESSGDYTKITAVIRNTTIAGNGVTGSGKGKGGGLFTTQKNVTLQNCIIAENTAATDADVSYFADEIASAVQIANCLVGGDPKFVGNGDYHLAKASPAKAAGVTYDGIDVDLDNVEFAEVPSIGCYEWVDNAPRAGMLILFK